MGMNDHRLVVVQVMIGASAIGGAGEAIALRIGRIGGDERLLVPFLKAKRVGFIHSGNTLDSIRDA